MKWQPIENWIKSNYVMYRRNEYFFFVVEKDAIELLEEHRFVTYAYVYRYRTQQSIVHKNIKSIITKKDIIELNEWENKDLWDYDDYKTDFGLPFNY